MNHEIPPQNELQGDSAAGKNGLIPRAAPLLNEDGDPVWKILVFDNLGRDVISSVLRVNDLRSWGVTIHLYVLVAPIFHLVAMADHQIVI